MRPWFIVLGLALGMAVSNSFGRFAYGLILPAMQEDLSWSYTAAGWLNTSHALGYLAGAVATLALIRYAGPAVLFAGGVAATAACLIATGLTADFGWLTVWRVGAGMFGAPVFISGAALTANLFERGDRRSSLAIAAYFGGGGGIGMVVAGLAMPGVFALGGPGAWPQAWLTLGAFSAIIAITALFVARALVRRAAAAPPQPLVAQKLPLAAMAPELLGYGLYAMGYIVYITFLLAFMRQLGTSDALAAAVWVALGLAVMVSPFVWRPVLARSSGGRALALTLLVTAVGTLLPVLVPSTAGLMASAVLFGIAVFIPPAAVTRFANVNLAASQQGSAVGLYTVVFAAMQIVGPVAAGAVGDAFSSIAIGLMAAAAVLFVGAAVALMQRPLPPRASS